MRSGKKKISLLYRFQRKLFTFLGDIKVFGWTHPMWFQINAHGYKLRGKHYYTIRDLIQPGDILIRRYDGYFSTYALPGFWTHCGLYIGDEGDKPEQVIHSVSEGVIQETLVEFMRTDHMLILRYPTSKTKTKINKAIKLAKSIVGKPYDFGFDFKDTHRFSCTELVAFCYPGVVEGKKKLGKMVIVADDFNKSDKLTTVWDSTQEDKQKGVVQSFLAKV